MLRALSSSLYKYTTFLAEIQIVLTLRNNSELLNLQRFARASLRHVLYYEGDSPGRTARGISPSAGNKKEASRERLASYYYTPLWWGGDSRVEIIC